MILDHVINEDINSREVRLINENGEQLGILVTYQALNKARQQGLDLVIVSDKGEIPVAKMLDYKKFRYEQTKIEKERSKKARASQTEIKEIQLRPVTDTHDLEIKAKKAQEFLSQGNKVKICIKFKGRELSHLDVGKTVLDNFLNLIGLYKVEKPSIFEGKNITVIVIPSK